MRTMLLLAVVVLLFPVFTADAFGKDGHPFAGRYTGLYVASIPTLDAGIWEVALDETGKGVGVMKSKAEEKSYDLKATVNKKGELEMILGPTEWGASFKGYIQRSGNVFGVWENPHAGPAYKGTFKGHRSDEKIGAPEDEKG